jgi:hypothetical protein
MKALVIGILGMGFLLQPSFAYAAKTNPPQPIASYQLQVRLHHKTRTIKGNATITWTNRTQTTATSLWFHLYMNAFKNEKSTFMQEMIVKRGFGSFGKRVTKNRWGWINIHRIKQSNGPDLTSRASFISPDDGNPHDRTVMKVALPTPVKPGQSITVAVQFSTKLPWAIMRTGYRKDFYYIGQWYPKLGVFQRHNNENKARWNCHQYHLTTEYFADFGHYRATLTVPSGFVVGATGKQLSKTSNPKEKTDTFVYAQKNVHDFAWTAFPRYKRIVKWFDPAKDVTDAERKEWSKRLALPVSQLALRKVQMVFMMQPEHMHQLGRHVSALKESIKRFGLWFGPYPYDVITLVDPAYEGKTRGFSGMEYATMFTAGTRWWQGKHDRTMEGLIFHEYGHMYFQGLVATNEFEEAWLDEGINTYVNTKLVDETYPKQRRSGRVLHTPMSAFSVPVHLSELMRVGYLALGPYSDPIYTKSWKFQSGFSYGQQVYSKAATMLRSLEGYIGTPTMERTLRSYVAAFAYKHPTTKDFIAHFQQHTKQDLKPFFEQFLFKTTKLDYAITTARTGLPFKAKGMFHPTLPRPPKQPKTRKTKPTTRPSNPTSTSPKKTKPKKTPPKTKYKPKPTTTYVSEVIVARKGSGILPVDIAFSFADGKVIKRTWDGKTAWKRYVFSRGSKLVSAEVDPDRRYPIDINITNNSRTTKQQTKTTLSWWVRLMTWFQHLFLLLTHVL